jgi:hypothetical protein
MGRVYRDGRILSVADSCLLLKMANRIKTSVCRAVGLWPLSAMNLRQRFKNSAKKKLNLDRARWPNRGVPSPETKRISASRSSKHWLVLVFRISTEKRCRPHTGLDWTGWSVWYRAMPWVHLCIFAAGVWIQAGGHNHMAGPVFSCSKSLRQGAACRFASATQACDPLPESIEFALRLVTSRAFYFLSEWNHGPRM